MQNKRVLGMRLNAKRPSSVHVTKLNVLSVLTLVHIFFLAFKHSSQKFKYVRLNDQV